MKKRNYLFYAAVILIVTTALVSGKPKVEKDVTLRLTVPETQLVLQALSKESWTSVNDLIVKISNQANAQLADTTSNQPKPVKK